MPFKPSINFIYKNKQVFGPLKAFDTENLWEGLEFELPMLNSFHEDYFGRGSMVQKFCGSEVKKHLAYIYSGFHSRCQPLVMCLESGRILPELYDIWKRSEVMDRLEIYWTRSNEKTGKEEIYFSQRLYPVRILSICLFMLNVKERGLEGCGHMVRVRFMYRFTEITYLPGYHYFKLDWNNFLHDNNGGEETGLFDECYFPFEKDPVTEKKEFLAKIKIHSLGWEHLEEDKKSDKKVSPGDCICLLADVDGVREGERICFELYYSTTEGQGREFASVSGRIRNGTGSAEWTVDVSNVKEKEYSIRFEPVVCSKYGGKCEIPLHKSCIGVVVPWFIDCHMHIQSTMCAPEPLIAGMSILKKLGSLPKLPGFIGTPGLIFSKSTTEQLGRLSLEKSAEVLNDKRLVGLGDPERRRRLMIVMPMDMDFGHYRGYSGLKIIDNTGNGLVIHKSIKTGAVKCTLPEFKKWEQYFTQLSATQKAFLDSSGSILPFFHYDPRRWNCPRWSMARKMGHWKDPFSFLVQTGNIDDLQKNISISKATGDCLNLSFFCAIGFKMYTALGYKPDDYDKLPGLSSYYNECANHKIPILCHGSRGGMVTHDFRHYFKNDCKYNPQDISDPSDIPPSLTKAKDYFDENFVSPYAWEQVLQRYPQLHLCLAHFGGEESWGKDRFKHKPDWFSKLYEMMKLYTNFYVDTSYFLFDDDFIGQFIEAVKDKQIRNKILFGTDWYMINLEWTRLGHGSSYRNFFKKTYDKFIHSDLLKADKYFPARAMLLNPLKFLNLKEILPKLNIVYKSLTGKECSLMEWVPGLPETIEQFKDSE